MTGRDIVVIGASAGGVQSLRELVSGLPEGLPAAILVVVHSGVESPGLLPQLLERMGPLRSRHARTGDRLEHGTIYVAPPDRHMILQDGTIEVTRGPRENGFRPAVDPLFRTAAEVAGPRVVGVVLSGGLSDGTHGLLTIKRHGGIAIVQRAEEAFVPSMPLSAIQNVDVDHIVSASDMGPLIARLSREPVMGSVRTSKKRDVAERGWHALHAKDLSGPPSAFRCPECGGALWELNDGDFLRYRCHVGHGFSADSLAAGQAVELETALWTALRTLEERAAFRRRLAKRARDNGLDTIADQYEEQVGDSERQAGIIRGVLTNDEDAAERASPAAPELAVPRRRRARR